MKKLLVMVLLFISFETNSSAMSISFNLRKFMIENWNKLITSIIQVESEGDPFAVGDNGKAVGILQIWPITVKDVNRILRKEVYTDEDRLNPTKSIEMFNIYQNHYNPTKDPVIASRIWNGGPTGMNKKKTESYWNKVKKLYES